MRYDFQQSNVRYFRTPPPPYKASNRPPGPQRPRRGVSQDPAWPALRAAAPDGGNAPPRALSTSRGRDVGAALAASPGGSRPHRDRPRQPLWHGDRLRQVPSPGQEASGPHPHGSRCRRIQPTRPTEPPLFFPARRGREQLWATGQIREKYAMWDTR